MRIGLALPQFDYSVPGEPTLRWETIAEHAVHAEHEGMDSVWLSDHIGFDVSKYGGPAERFFAYDPLVTLAALARVTERVRLGTLVLCEALRPASVVAKSLAAIDRLSAGRLDVGLGAGWYEPDYDAIGLEFPPAPERLARLRDALTVCRELLGGGPSTYGGNFHRTSGAWNRPPTSQQPRAPVFVGGKGDRLLGIVAELADGWNTCWTWTVDEYRRRLEVLERACARVGRDPSTVTRSLGLYALVGEDARDLERRFDRLRASTPPGVLDGVTLETWRVGHLVGTVDEVRVQARQWADLGVETLVVGVGAAPFAVTSLDDVTLLARALVGL